MNRIYKWAYWCKAANVFGITYPAHWSVKSFDNAVEAEQTRSAYDKHGYITKWLAHG